MQLSKRFVFKQRIGCQLNELTELIHQETANFRLFALKQLVGSVVQKRFHRVDTTQRSKTNANDNKLTSKAAQTNNRNSASTADI